MVGGGKMIIVFEGIDGVGKTTVAKEVAKRLGALYLKHPSKEIIDKIEKVNDVIEKLLLFTYDRRKLLNSIKEEKLVIMDRFSFSSAVYQMFYHNLYHIFDTFYYFEKEVVMKDFEDIIKLVIILKADIKVVKERLDKKKEKHSLRKLKELQELYLEEVPEFYPEIKFKVIDTTDMSIEEVIKECIGLIKEVVVC